MWRLNRRAATAIVFVALGVFLAPRDQLPIAANDRFTTIEAPIESDWSARDHFRVLHASHFLADGVEVSAPIAIYARFDPPPIAWQAVVRVEGFVRRTEDRYSVAVKSPRLMTYGGRVSPLAPSTWNRAIEQRLQRYASTDPAEIAMIEALVLGRGERLSADAKENFRRGGTYHLLVFSGLQIALAAAVIAFALRWAGAPRVSDWSLIAFAALAPPFIGPTASVSRASVGIALYAISRVLKRPTSFENLWCVAALVRLIIAPRDLTDPAFHLTYAGAGALIFIGKPFPSRWISYAFAAELVITPLTLFHFHQFALGGSVMTIVLTPIIFVMLIVGSLFCAMEITLLLKLMSVLNAVCSFLNDLSAPLSGFFAAPPQAALAIGLIAALVAIAMLREKRRAMAAALALTIPTAFAIARHVSQRTTQCPQIAFLDVGQGDAILLRSGSHNVLVDGGGRIGDARFGETLLLPLLVDRGVRRLDIVVLSHAHPDHCGGLPAVLEQLRVRELWINPRRFREECAQEMLEAVRHSATPVRLIKKEVTAGIGEMHIEAFAAQRGFRRAAENNSSVVVRVEARRRAFLLTGDIEREAEAELAAQIRPVDLLKIPHHGSRSSSTPALLDAARPRIAVISCGVKNWFGHPHPSVVNSLSARNIQLWRTDENGTIDVAVDHAIFCRPQFDTPR